MNFASKLQSKLNKSNEQLFTVCQVFTCSDLSHKRWPSLFVIIILSEGVCGSVSRLKHCICQVLAVLGGFQHPCLRIQLISSGWGGWGNKKRQMNKWNKKKKLKKPNQKNLVRTLRTLVFYSILYTYIEIIYCIYIHIYNLYIFSIFSCIPDSVFIL